MQLSLILLIWNTESVNICNIMIDCFDWERYSVFLAREIIKICVFETIISNSVIKTAVLHVRCVERKRMGYFVCLYSVYSALTASGHMSKVVNLCQEWGSWTQIAKNCRKNTMLSVHSWVLYYFPQRFVNCKGTHKEKNVFADPKMAMQTQKLAKEACVTLCFEVNYGFW